MGDQTEIQQKIVNVLHASQLGGYSGIQVSYVRANAMFYWPGMKGDIKRTILECDVCRRCKGENVPYPGLLQPLPDPNYSWSHITMDFIEGLPKSKGKEVILVVIDKFTKYAHFVGLSHPFLPSQWPESSWIIYISYMDFLRR